MKSLLDHLARYRSSWPIIGVILAISALMVSSVIFLHLWKEIPTDHLTRDLNSIMEVPFYIGFLSQIGLFLWSATVAVCMFSARILSRRATRHPLTSFLLSSGLLTMLLGLDDAFQLHEEVLPAIGIPEIVVYASYLLLLLLYLIKYQSIIRQTEHILLIMALLFFGVSVILDILEYPPRAQYVFEDGAKLVAIISWMAYFLRTGASAVYAPARQQTVIRDSYLASLPGKRA